MKPMNPENFLLLALKRKITAISKSDGQQLWCTELPGGSFGSSSTFITLVCDDARIFAYSSGHLHCLDLSSGQLLWTNELPGYGYGLASLCVPAFASAPDIAAIKHFINKRNASAAGATSATAAAS